MMFSFAVNVGVSCNFEQSLCSSWTQDNSDVFDWTRRSGSTGSSGTGPSVDHTTGTGNELVFFLDIVAYVHIKIHHIGGLF